MRSTHLAVVALTLALSACSNADSASPPPFTPGTAATSPSASATVQPESAEEFIRRWVKAGDDMQRSGDTSTYRLMSRGCKACDGFADTVDRIYAAGGQITPEGSVVQRTRSNGRSSYEVTVREGKTQYTESASGQVQHLDGGTVTLRVYVKSTPQGWVVTNYTQLADLP